MSTSDDRRRGKLWKVSDDSVSCLVCGKRYKLLNHMHLKKHGLTPETYKEKFGLNRTHPLASGDLRTYLKANSINKDTARYLEGHRLSDPGGTTRGRQFPLRPQGRRRAFHRRDPQATPAR